MYGSPWATPGPGNTERHPFRGHVVGQCGDASNDPTNEDLHEKCAETGTTEKFRQPEIGLQTEQIQRGNRRKDSRKMHHEKVLQMCLRLEILFLLDLFQPG